MFNRDLEYILAIADEENITRAASKLHIAQPSLTQKLQRLEKELGCLLFNRTNQGVKLTEAGEAYYRMAKQILNIYNGFLFEIGQLSRLETGRLSIGASWYISTTFLPEILSCYSEQFPNIEVELVESRSSELLRFLRSGKIDIAFISRFPHELNNQEKRFQYKHICRDDFCVIASKKYNLSDKCYFDPKVDTPKIRLQTLENQPFIMFHKTQRLRQITDMMFRQANIRPIIKMTTYGFPIAVEQVAIGHGFAILPRFYINTVRNDYPIQIFSIDKKYNAYWDVGICYYNSYILPAALEAFIKSIYLESR